MKKNLLRLLMNWFNEPIDLLLIFIVLSGIFGYISIKSYEWFFNTYTIISAILSGISLGITAVCIISAFYIADEIRKDDNR